MHTEQGGVRRYFCRHGVLGWDHIHTYIHDDDRISESDSLKACFYLCAFIGIDFFTRRILWTIFVPDITYDWFSKCVP